MKRLRSIPFMVTIIFLVSSIFLLKSEPLMAASKTASRTVRSEEGHFPPYVEIVYKNDSDNMADRRKVSYLQTAAESSTGCTLTIPKKTDGRVIVWAKRFLKRGK